MSSVTFDICQVCGSYQCPNCPEPSFYLSSSSSTRPNNLLVPMLLACLLPTVLSASAWFAAMSLFTSFTKVLHVNTILRSNFNLSMIIQNFFEKIKALFDRSEIRKYLSSKRESEINVIFLIFYFAMSCISGSLIFNDHLLYIDYLVALFVISLLSLVLYNVQNKNTNLQSFHETPKIEIATR